jgi:hypothetical protein
MHDTRPVLNMVTFAGFDEAEGTGDLPYAPRCVPGPLDLVIPVEQLKHPSQEVHPTSSRHFAPELLPRLLDGGISM